MSESSNDIGNSHVNVLKQPQLSKSDIFGVLQNDRRRHVLEILHSKGSQSVRSLSEEIARLESKTDEPKTNVRKSIYISLLQTHIPKMENLNVITYDREKDTVKLLPTAQNFDIYMETVKKGDIPWSHFYFGLSTLTAVGSVTIFSGLIKWISGSQWMLFISAIFLASSIAHLRHFRKLEE